MQDHQLPPNNNKVEVDRRQQPFLQQQQQHPSYYYNPCCRGSEKEISNDAADDDDDLVDVVTMEDDQDQDQEVEEEDMNEGQQHPFGRRRCRSNSLSSQSTSDSSNSSSHHSTTALTAQCPLLPQRGKDAAVAGRDNGAAGAGGTTTSVPPSAIHHYLRKTKLNRRQAHLVNYLSMQTSHMNLSRTDVNRNTRSSSERLAAVALSRSTALSSGNHPQGSCIAALPLSSSALFAARHPINTIAAATTTNNNNFNNMDGDRPTNQQYNHHHQLKPMQQQQQQQQQHPYVSAESNRMDLTTLDLPMKEEEGKAIASKRDTEAKEEQTEEDGFKQRVLEALHRRIQACDDKRGITNDQQKQQQQKRMMLQALERLLFHRPSSTNAASPSTSSSSLLPASDSSMIEMNQVIHGHKFKNPEHALNAALHILMAKLINRRSRKQRQKQCKSQVSLSTATPPSNNGGDRRPPCTEDKSSSNEVIMSGDESPRLSVLRQVLGDARYEEAIGLANAIERIRFLRASIGCSNGVCMHQVQTTSKIRTLPQVMPEPVRRLFFHTELCHAIQNTSIQSIPSVPWNLLIGNAQKDLDAYHAWSLQHHNNANLPP